MPLYLPIGLALDGSAPLLEVRRSSVVEKCLLFRNSFDFQRPMSNAPVFFQGRSERTVASTPGPTSLTACKFGDNLIG
jgi:hypothetical protein